jgi:hypothetical protein
MGLAVKISDDLVLAARQEARTAKRSLTSQIEYWASIGRATEILMTHRELLGLSGLNDLFPAGSRREEVHRLLTRLVEQPEARAEALALIHAQGAPVYETDSAHPGKIIQVSRDGKRTPGRFKNRRFVPDEPLRR